VLWVGDADDAADLLAGATAPATEPTAWLTGCTTEPAAWVTELRGAAPDAGLAAVEPSANSSAAATPTAGMPTAPTRAARAARKTRRQPPDRKRQLMRSLQLVPRYARLNLRRPLQSVVFVTVTKGKECM
jgi:hypothetical protein